MLSFSFFLLVACWLFVGCLVCVVVFLIPAAFQAWNEGKEGKVREGMSERARGDE